MRTIYKQDAFPKIPRRKRAAAYARVSSGKDAMKHSLSAQISYYNNLIGKRIDWIFAGVYADEPVTGTKDNRPEFNRLLADCRAGKIDMVITKSVTRFARNTVTTLESVRELKLLGVDVYFENEKIHSMSGDGELMLSILASYAQEESRTASENVKWRIRKMFQEGRPYTRRMLGYRLLDSTYYVVPGEAETVRKIFMDYLGGMGATAIAKKLQNAGVSAPVGAVWRQNTIAKIIRNDAYTGSMTLQKTFISDHITKKKCINRGELPIYRVENSHEAIIDKTVFEAVQAEIERRAAKYNPKPASESFPFTGLIKCGQCNARFIRKRTAVKTKYEKAVWICHTFDTLGKAACGSQRIPESILLAKTAEALGLEVFDESIFRIQIKEIRVPASYRLCFVFKDGRTIETEWKHQSRRESWTPEMKQIARERQLRINEERRKINGQR